MRLRRTGLAAGAVATLGLAIACGLVALRWRPAGGGFAPAGKDLNVVLITIDTLRADRVGCYGYAGARTPHIDALAARGVVFEQCISPCPLTLPSHASLLTGMYPFTHGARSNGRYVIRPQHVTLAESLKADGYATHAVVAAVVLNREFGLDQGFDTYVDVRTSANPRLGTVAERRGDEVSDAAIEALRSAAGRKFFLWVHYYDPHAPYEAPPEFEVPGGHPYDAEVAYADAQVGLLMAELRRLRVDDHTLVIVTSDHGEGLGEHGESMHGYFVYDTTLHVPLVLSCPAALPAGRRVGAQVRLIDLMPTLLEWLRLDAPQGMDGVSVAALVKSRTNDPMLPAYAEALDPYFDFGFAPLHALRRDGWKYIHAPSPHLYDVRRDPGESQNVAALEPMRAAELDLELRRVVASTATNAADLGASEAPNSLEMRELRAQIEALGYLGASQSAELVGADAEVSLLDSAAADPHERAGEIERLFRATALFQGGRPAEAEALLREALPEGGDAATMPRVCRQLAHLLSSMDRHAEAIEFYDALLRANPRDGRALTNKATALAELGRYEESIATFEAALKVPPVMPRTYQNYSLTLVRMGKLDEALERLNRAVEADPQSVDARLVRARVLVSAGRAPEAVAKLRRSVALLPKSIRLRTLLAELLAADGCCWEEVREHWRTLAERLPADPRPRFGLAQACAKLGQPDDAEQNLRHVVEIDPRHALAWHALGTLQASSRRWGEAARSFRAALNANPRSIDVQNDLAWLLATCPDAFVRDGGEALRLARSANDATEGRSPYVLSTLSAALAETGRFEEAAPPLEEAIRRAREQRYDGLLPKLERQLDAVRSRKPFRQGANGA